MKKRLPKTLFVLFVTLLCILIPAYDVMTAYSAMINNALNIQSYRVVESDIAADYDSEYFKADFSDPEAYAKAAAELCRQVEAEGLVLLTNQNGALPLPKQAKVSFFAQGAVYPGYGSTGSSAAKTDGYGSLRTAFEKKGFSVNGALWDWYAQKAPRLRLNTVDGLVKTYRTNELPWEDVTAAQGESFANFGDAAIVVLTRDSGEGFDVSTKGSDGLDGSYLSITKEEEDLLKGLTELKQSGVFKRVIVLLNAAVPMQLDFLYRADIDVDACLWVGNIGMSGAMGIADVLAGSVNPSGRLTDTYTRDNFSSPAMASWVLNPNGIFAQPYANATEMNLNSSQQYYGVYVEGIYVGYRYYETRYEDYVIGRDQSGEYDYSVVAFPFGHGLSYTTFAYSDMKVTRQADSDSCVVTLTVTNTGSCAGAEVVQLYVAKPDAKVFRPAKELKGFTKVQLEAGESKTVTIPLDDKAFRYWNVKTDRWEVEGGSYQLLVGASSADIRLTAAVTVAGTGAPDPYAGKDLAHYRTAQVQNVPDAEFEALLGRPIPENKVHIDRNMTLGEMGHGRSPIGWLAAAVLGTLLRRSIKKGKPDLNILFQYNMPLRALAKMTNGAISMGMVDGIVMELRGFWVIGLVRVIVEAVKNLVLNSRMEERLKNS